MHGCFSYVDGGETPQSAVVRELLEETGISIRREMCRNFRIQLLAGCESAYPPNTAAGPPRRHNLALHHYVPLGEQYSTEALCSQVALQQSEVAALAWIDLNLAQAIVSKTALGSERGVPHPELIPETFLAFERRDDGNLKKCVYPVSELTDRDMVNLDRLARPLSEWILLKNATSSPRTF